MDDKEVFRQIIDKNPDAILMVNKKGVVCFVNPAAESMFGRDENEFLGNFFGYPLEIGKTGEISILSSMKGLRTAEMQVVEIKWNNENVYLVTLRDITGHKIVKKQLEKSTEKLKCIFKQTVKALVSAAEKRDPYTAGHQQEVAKLANAIAERMDLPENQKEAVSIAGILHDIGKIYVPDVILNKIGGLSEADFDAIKNHPQFSYDIVKEIDFPWPIANIVVQHHERLDGSGYPMSLRDENILLEAKIIGVADVVEAMSADRPYRVSLGIDKALEEISSNKGKLYDPMVVDICLKLFKQDKFSFQR